MNKFSLFESAFNAEPIGTVSLATVAKVIIDDPKRRLPQQEAIRAKATKAEDDARETGADAETIDKAFKSVIGRYKDRMRCVSFSADFSKMEKPWRQASEFIHTGLYCLDYDGIHDKLLCQQIIDTASAQASTTLAFMSPSHRGVKIVVLADVIPETNDENHGVYKRIAKHYDTLLQIESSHDKSTKDASRLCYIPADPNAMYNPDAVPLCVDELDEVEDEWTEPVPEPTKTRTESNDEFDEAPLSKRIEGCLLYTSPSPRD